LSIPSIAADPTCPTCKAGCEIASLIPIYSRGPSLSGQVDPPHQQTRKPSESHKKVPRALRFADVFLLPYMKSPSSSRTPLPPRPQAKRIPPRSLRPSPIYMLLHSAQQHITLVPEGTVLAVPQTSSVRRFGRSHMYMLVFAIWAALFKMMADSGRTWRSLSSSIQAGTGTRWTGGAEGDSAGRYGLILGMFLGFGLLWYRSRHINNGIHV
jgi:hypothetical protein